MPALAIRREAHDEQIVAIDETGGIRPVGKLDAHYRGVRHLAVSVFVFGGGRLLVQRRAFGKYHSGGQWANTCCSHPWWGEAPSACAHRRLREEVGLTVPLTAGAVVDYRADVGNRMVEHERVHVFAGELPASAADEQRGSLLDGFDPAEVQDLAWLSRAELEAAVVADPNAFAPWLRIYLDRWGELGLPMRF